MYMHMYTDLFCFSSLFFFLLPLLLLIKLLQRHEAGMYLIYVLRNLLFTMNPKVFNLVQWDSLIFWWPFIWWFVALIKDKTRTFLVLTRTLFGANSTGTRLVFNIPPSTKDLHFVHIYKYIWWSQNNMNTQLSVQNWTTTKYWPTVEDSRYKCKQDV